MAKKSMINTNLRRKKLVARYRGTRARLRAQARDRNISLEERFKAQVALSELPRNSAKVRVRNRCLVTGRPRGYLSRFRMSRLSLRDLMNKGLIPGLTKSSW
ncbi:MAG: 30S ribosomal protein S14 [Pseudomonadota bacterium]